MFMSRSVQSYYQSYYQFSRPSSCSSLQGQLPIIQLILICLLLYATLYKNVSLPIASTIYSSSYSRGLLFGWVVLSSCFCLPTRNLVSVITLASRALYQANSLTRHQFDYTRCFLLYTMYLMSSFRFQYSQVA